MKTLALALLAIPLLGACAVTDRGKRVAVSVGKGIAYPFSQAAHAAVRPALAARERKIRLVGECSRDGPVICPAVLKGDDGVFLLSTTSSRLGARILKDDKRSAKRRAKGKAAALFRANWDQSSATISDDGLVTFELTSVRQRKGK